MSPLIRAELLKLSTTRTAFWLVIGLPVAVALSLASTIAGAGRDNMTFPLETVEGVRHVLSAAASSGGLIALILGIVAVTGEYRHQTVTQTFLLCPVRGRVVAAKLAAYAVVGLAVALAADALTLAMGLPWLAGSGGHPRILQDVGLVLAGATAGTVLYGALGVAVGALVRNQTAAIVMSLAWVMVLESLLVALLPELGRWLPGGAASALAGASLRTGDLLPMWAAALMLAAYTIGFAVVGSRSMVRRDVG